MVTSCTSALMSEKLKRIVLASVLKPLDDPRMFEKFARTLARHYEVHIIGYNSGLPQGAARNIYFHPLPRFPKNNLRRLWLHGFILKKILSVKPHLLVVHAVELLPVAVLYKLRFFRPVVYDVRENYFRNIRHQPVYQHWWRLPLAVCTRLLEMLSWPLVSCFFVAEKGYLKEMPFLKSKAVLLENKFAPLEGLQRNRQPYKGQGTIKLVYCGTISETFGALEAITLASNFNNNGIKAELVMAGRIAGKQLARHLKLYEQNLPFLTLVTGSPLLSHRQVMEQLLDADFAVLSYRVNKSTRNCIPTTMYECIANQIPMIVQQNRLWEEICQPLNAAVFTDFSDFHPVELYQQLVNTQFYENSDTGFALWDKQEQHLVAKVSRICG